MVIAPERSGNADTIAGVFCYSVYTFRENVSVGDGGVGGRDRQVSI